MSLISTEIPTPLAAYLLPGERVVAAVHHHWVRVAEPVASAILALVVVLWIDSNVTARTQFVLTPLWLGFWFLALRAVWQVLEWRHDWFVATDKRLLLRYGLVTHKVAMMPLLKVTDMSYVRSIPGQLLGYGRFIMESAGQDQAMRVVNWVPHPDATYRAICAVIFHIETPVVVTDDHATETDGLGDLGDLDLDAAARADRAAFPDVPPIHNPIQDRLDSYSRPLPIRSGERFYASEDLRERRGADTGPIPQRGWRRRRNPPPA